MGRALVLVLALGGLLGALAPEARGALVLPGEHPDPGALRHGGRLWVATTGSRAGAILPIAVSADGRRFRPAGSVLRRAPRWSRGLFWAPHLAWIGRRHLAYYAALDRRRRHCVAVATARRAGGPYRDRGPLVCQPTGAIDPSVGRDERGRLVLVWKANSGGGGRSAVVHVQRLAADGLRLVGPRRELLRGRSGWEGRDAENPQLVGHGGRLYLFYSGGSCCGPRCDYAVGVARAPGLLGPWVRAPHNPLLGPTRRWRCPGGGSVVVDARGRSWMLYHAYDARRRARGRQGLLDRVLWGADGWPRIALGRTPAASPRGAATGAPLSAGLS